MMDEEGADAAGTDSAAAARYLLDRGHLYTVIDAAIKGERTRLQPRLLPPPPFAGKGCKFGKTASLTSGCLLHLPGASVITPGLQPHAWHAGHRISPGPLSLGKTGREMPRGLPCLEEGWKAEQ